jgi:hypothetical protein
MHRPANQHVYQRSILIRIGHDHLIQLVSEEKLIINNKHNAKSICDALMLSSSTGGYSNVIHHQTRHTNLSHFVWVSRFGVDYVGGDQLAEVTSDGPRLGR